MCATAAGTALGRQLTPLICQFRIGDHRPPRSTPHHRRRAMRECRQDLGGLSLWIEELDGVNFKTRNGARDTLLSFYSLVQRMEGMAG